MVCLVRLVSHEKNRFNLTQVWGKNGIQLEFGLFRAKFLAKTVGFLVVFFPCPKDLQFGGTVHAQQLRGS